MGRILIQLSILLFLLAPAHSAGLCTRCETVEVLALKRYYGTLNVDAVTFRGFIANLLTTMEGMPRLAPLRAEIMDLIHRYDDCIRTCEIPFTKRAPSNSDEDVLALDLWLGESKGEGKGKSSPEATQKDMLDFIMRRRGQRDAGERISILISPDFVANWIKDRMNNSRRKSTDRR